jgi:xanthine dehydrogenase/oxidase
VTGVPRNRIVAKSKRIGGGFGGKETRSFQLACILAIGAKKLRRPVRCMLDRDLDMMTTGQRHPYYGKWKVGTDTKGKIVALIIEVFNNAGSSL